MVYFYFSVNMSEESCFSSYTLNRYLNKETNEKTWTDIVNRVSAIYTPIREHILSKQFIPSERILTTLGTSKPMVPNCVAIDLHDDLENIFETMERLMELTRRGCDIGMNFGELRPARTFCKKYNAYSSGPVGFLNMFSVAIKTVQQQSKHGAFIGILPITHPDILSFIHVKQNLNLMTNFNSSVLIPTDFIDKLLKTPNELVKSDYEFKHFDGITEKITTINYISYDDNFIALNSTPINITYKELFNEVIDCIWKTGEPGILFEDNINKENPLKDFLGNIKICNPHGEISMYENECCIMGSINLSKFVDEIDIDPLKSSRDDLLSDDKNIAKCIYNKYVHVVGLSCCVRSVVIYLNEVIEHIKTDDKKIDDFVKLSRRLGLGIMGFHDMLILLKLPYDSEAARELVKLVMKLIKETAEATSKELAKKYKSYGDRFYKTEKITNIKILLNPHSSKFCNIALLTVAPNDSTPMIDNISSGIEPYLSLGYYRKHDNATRENELIINKQLRHWIQKHIAKDEQEHIIKTIINKGIDKCESIPNYIKEVFKTSQQITPTDNIKMMAVVQMYVDNSISKTINLPEEATKEDILNAFLLAHKLGIKVMTIYRDNCRKNILKSSLSVDSCKDGKCNI